MGKNGKGTEKPQKKPMKPLPTTEYKPIPRISFIGCKYC